MLGDEDCLVHDAHARAHAQPDARRRSEQLSKTRRTVQSKRSQAGDKRCTSCGTTSTPVWRWGGEAKEVLLCNACSLRIRRAGSRPQAQQHKGAADHAAAAATAAAPKQSPGLVSTDSGSPTSERVLAELPPCEAEALRQQLLASVEDFIEQEKFRLLGPREAPAQPDEWLAQAPRLPPYPAAHMLGHGPGPEFAGGADFAAYPLPAARYYSREAGRDELAAASAAAMGGFLYGSGEPGLVRMH